MGRKTQCGCHISSPKVSIGGCSSEWSAPLRSGLFSPLEGGWLAPPGHFAIESPKQTSV